MQRLKINFSPIPVLNRELAADDSKRCNQTLILLLKFESYSPPLAYLDPQYILSNPEAIIPNVSKNFKTITNVS